MSLSHQSRDTGAFLTSHKNNIEGWDVLPLTDGNVVIRVSNICKDAGVAGGSGPS